MYNIYLLVANSLNPLAAYTGLEYPGRTSLPSFTNGSNKANWNGMKNVTLIMENNYQFIVFSQHLKGRGQYLQGIPTSQLGHSEIKCSNKYLNQ